MAELQWPQQRLDVIAGLLALSTLADAQDPARVWPDLTSAVHWVVDDTSWDHHPPDDEIGKRLRDQAEVNAIRAVLTPLLQVLTELGPARPDAEYLRHVCWSDVARSARLAAGPLSTNDQQ